MPASKGSKRKASATDKGEDSLADNEENKKVAKKATPDADTLEANIEHCKSW